MTYFLVPVKLPINDPFQSHKANSDQIDQFNSHQTWHQKSSDKKSPEINHKPQTTKTKDQEIEK